MVSVPVFDVHVVMYFGFDVDLTNKLDVHVFCQTEHYQCILIKIQSGRRSYNIRTVQRVGLNPKYCVSVTKLFNISDITSEPVLSIVRSALNRISGISVPVRSYVHLELDSVKDWFDNHKVPFNRRYTWNVPTSAVDKE